MKNLSKLQSEAVKLFKEQFTAIVSYEKWSDEDEATKLREPQYLWQDLIKHNPKPVEQFLSDQIQKAVEETRKEEHKLCVKTHLSELERWCIYDPTAPKDFEENYLSIQSKGK
jgi:hypothetical protein